jgi:uncharacterized protein
MDDAVVGTAAGTPVRRRPEVGWTELVVGAVAYLVLAAALAVAVLSLELDPVGLSLGLLLGAGVPAVAAAFIALAPRVRSVRPLGLQRTTARWLLIGLGAGVAVWLLNRVIIVTWLLVSGDTTNPQEGLLGGLDGLALVGTLALGAVLVPFGEELLFRGIGYTALRRYGMWVAAIASAVVFGVAHGINIVLPAAIVLGVVNAVLFERSRSIWPAVVAHVVNNAIVFVTAAVVL